MDSRLAQFVRGLYFDMQTIEGVQPLEIWNGMREKLRSYEMACLVKNLYKIVDPAGERELLRDGRSCVHSRACESVTRSWSGFPRTPKRGSSSAFPIRRPETATRRSCTAW